LSFSRLSRRIFLIAGSFRMASCQSANFMAHSYFAVCVL
jgi:hypothetical protein